MVRRCLLVLFTLILGLGLTSASASATPSLSPGYMGIVKLSNCSGSLVRLPDSHDSDRALVLTNGHCDEAGMPAPGVVTVDRPVDRTMRLLGADGGELGDLHAKTLVYGTMTDTDVTLYRLDETYRQLYRRLGGVPLTISASPANVGTNVSIRSGYFARTWNCSIERVVYSLREADWVWHASMRYDAGCDTIHGTSGSPIIDDTSGAVVGINNTGNDDGYSCTLDNPCEIDENGVVTVLPKRTYGQQTYQLAACVRASEIRLQRAGCTLPKPATVTRPAPAPAPVPAPAGSPAPVPVPA